MTDISEIMARLETASVAMPEIVGVANRPGNEVLRDFMQVAAGALGIAAQKLVSFKAAYEGAEARATKLGDALDRLMHHYHDAGGAARDDAYLNAVRVRRNNP